jgi:hypothetical protein
MRSVAAAAVFAAMAACTNTGSLGNILGGVLGTPSGMQVGATVQSVDTRNQQITMTQSNGQTLGVFYDNRTRVVYQSSLYPVTSLEYGDQIVARLQDNGNNTYYTDSIYVTQPVNGSTTGNSANVQAMSGTVRQIDTNAGWFAMSAGNGAMLTVSLPYRPRPSSQDLNRFNSLRVGDFVRIYGVYLGNNRVELRSFY